jgi:hypothetical protein
MATRLQRLSSIHSTILGYGVHTSLEKPKSVALAPQFWGELDYIWGFLPLKLGGRGGQCRVERLQSRDVCTSQELGDRAQSARFANAKIVMFQIVFSGQTSLILNTLVIKDSN